MGSFQIQFVRATVELCHSDRPPRIVSLLYPLWSTRQDPNTSRVFGVPQQMVLATNPLPARPPEPEGAGREDGSVTCQPPESLGSGSHASLHHRSVEKDSG